MPNIETLINDIVNSKMKDLTRNEDIQELFYSFFTNINYSKIPKEALLECVILEPRIEKNLRNVLNNFTTILPFASFTIFHSEENCQYIKNIIGPVHNFNLKLLPKGFNKKMYSEYLTSADFWNQLHGDKILIFQVDTGIRRNNILTFWEYSYIGAPWDWLIYGSDKVKIGNGGLSLRDRKIMIDICNQFTLNENDPEDTFFGIHLIDFPNVILPTVHKAYEFSIEFKSKTISEIKYDSMGFHQIIDKWDREFLIDFFSHFEIPSKDPQELFTKVYFEHSHELPTPQENTKKMRENSFLFSWIQLGIGSYGLHIGKDTQIPYIDGEHGHLNIHWRNNVNKFVVVNKRIIQDISLQ